MDTFLYFAYGSNMLTKRLQERCPSAKAIGNAIAQGFVFAFSKPSIDGSGKATLIKSTNPVDSAFGIVFEVNSDERGDLDRVEGKDYEVKHPFPVIRFGSREKVDTVVYIAPPEKCTPRLLPYDWYHSLVVAGAIEHELPEQYVRHLRSFSSIPDPDLNRKNRLEALRASSMK